jgi:hypothetical protein
VPYLYLYFTVLLSLAVLWLRCVWLFFRPAPRVSPVPRSVRVDYTTKAAPGSRFTAGRLDAQVQGTDVFNLINSIIKGYSDITGYSEGLEKVVDLQKMNALSPEATAAAMKGAPPAPAPAPAPAEGGWKYRVGQWVRFVASDACYGSCLARIVELDRLKQTGLEEIHWYRVELFPPPKDGRGLISTSTLESWINPARPEDGEVWQYICCPEHNPGTMTFRCKAPSPEWNPKNVRLLCGCLVPVNFGKGPA